MRINNSPQFIIGKFDCLSNKQNGSDINGLHYSRNYGMNCALIIEFNYLFY